MKQVPMSTELVPESIAREPIRLTGTLHEGATRSRFTSHEQRHPDGALSAHHGDLGRRAVTHDVQERDDRVRRKIDVPQCGTGFVEHLAEWHWNQLEMRKKSFALGRRQGAEDVVVVGFVSAVHPFASV